MRADPRSGTAAQPWANALPSCASDSSSGKWSYNNHGVEGEVKSFSIESPGQCPGTEQVSAFVVIVIHPLAVHLGRKRGPRSHSQLKQLAPDPQPPDPTSSSELRLFGVGLPGRHGVWSSEPGRQGIRGQQGGLPGGRNSWSKRVRVGMGGNHVQCASQ